SKMGVSSGGGIIGAIIVAFVGAVVLLFLLRLIRRA
ncbi:MAG TPA: GlsB/YeaQ/YmgE family stress response membrane protein, partial [Thermoanaerobaculia bacterium]|nr:GlsB/YeaQ/YmgE family stress response membrane protein [Thermoanaerobaculia bacterium]